MSSNCIGYSLPIGALVQGATCVDDTARMEIGLSGEGFGAGNAGSTEAVRRGLRTGSADAHSSWEAAALVSLHMPDIPGREHWIATHTTSPTA